MDKPLTVIVGPTAVGKTDTAVLVALGLDGEIVSADSMQIYRYMDIGTAKPTKEEMKGVRHHMIDVINPDQAFSVADFQAMARKHIEDIHGRGKRPIVVGGTGLYINSLVYALDFTETASNPELRESLEELAKERGNEYVYNLLKKADWDTAAKLHPNDIRRVIRALEVYICSGKPMSQQKNSIREGAVSYKLTMFGLRMNRESLYRRIEQRVDRMIEEGLVAEVKRLLDMGCTEKMISMQGLGYKEIIGYLNGEYSLEQAVEILKRDTRRYAKRQFTWFKRDDRIIWIDVEKYDSTAQVARFIIENVKADTDG